MERSREMRGSALALLVMFLAFAAPGATAAGAKVRTETVVYKHGDTTLEGFLAYPEASSRPLPGVLVVHDWGGPGDYSRRRAEQLAEAGYVAFAIDMYGQGVRPTTMEEKAKQAGIYRSDRALMRARARAGLDRAPRQSRGSTRSGSRPSATASAAGRRSSWLAAGAPLAGVVSFHGNLDTPNPADAKAIQAKILVCHGADDPYVPAEQVSAFQKEMRDAGVDCQFIAYSGAVHAFTQKEAGNDPSKGAAYNEAADRRSWQAMRAFFAEIFP